MRSISYITYLIIGSAFFFACTEEMPAPISTVGDQPGQVSGIAVENRPGGAMLTYTLPEDDDLLYVKAEYEYPVGNLREVRASMYVDTLVITGIGDTKELEVELFSVSRSEKVSDPVTVSIHPLAPPVWLIQSSLEIVSDFGGVLVSFENMHRIDAVIEVLKKEAEEWLPIESFYTNADSGFFSVRGQDAEMTEFGVYVRDRWRNKSDTTVISLTPLFEVELDDPTPVTSLPGDYNLHFNNLHYGYAFDENYSNYAGTLLTATSTFPLSFTLDFETPKKFSRLKYWMRAGDSNIFNYATPDEWEIWGSNELTDDWGKWTKIMDCVAEKPSGGALGVLTAADREAAAAGLDFTFPSDTPPYRYLRWKTKSTFGSLNAVQIAELAFFGGKID